MKTIVQQIKDLYNKVCCLRKDLDSIPSETITTITQSSSGTYTYTNEAGEKFDFVIPETQCPIDSSSNISTSFNIFTKSDTDPCQFKKVVLPCENIETIKSSINAIVPVNDSNELFQRGIVNEYLRIVGADEFDLTTYSLLNNYDVFSVESDTAQNVLPTTLPDCRSNIIQITFESLVGNPYAYGVDLPNVDITGSFFGFGPGTSLKAVMGRNIRAGEHFKFIYKPYSQSYSIGS